MSVCLCERVPVRVPVCVCVCACVCGCACGCVLHGLAMAYQDRAKAEQELAEHVKKALSDQETAPKQKHVRGTAGSLRTSLHVCLCLYVREGGRRHTGSPRARRERYVWRSSASSNASPHQALSSTRSIFRRRRRTGRR